MGLICFILYSKAKRRNTISTIALNKVNSLNRNANGDFLLLTNDEKLSKMTSIEINEINSMGKALIFLF
jgi:hypothetical protein